jgi:hypothetical protein
MLMVARAYRAAGRVGKRRNAFARGIGNSRRPGRLDTRGFGVKSWHYRPAVIDWSGIFHILATPFSDDGALDVDGLPRLIRFESQPGSVPGTSLAIRKEILRRRGWLRSAYVRHPAAAPDAATLEELSEVLAAVVPG